MAWEFWEVKSGNTDGEFPLPETEAASQLLSGILGSVVQEVSVGTDTSVPGTRGRGLHSSRKGELSPPRVPVPAFTLPFLRFAGGQR